MNKIFTNKPAMLVIGDLMLDRYIFGDVDRISPEAPVPIVKCTNEQFMLGGCGNVINNLNNLGSKPSIISVIGEDLAGKQIFKALKNKGISNSEIITNPNIPTTEKMRIIAARQQTVRVDWDSKEFDLKIYNELLTRLSPKINESDGIIISDYGKGVCTETILKEVIKLAQKNRVPVFIDPKGADWVKYSFANLITPNIKETEMIIGSKLLYDTDFEKAGIHICNTYKIDACLITRGKDGMSYISNDTIFHLRSEAKEIFDVSGAGDTVISVVALGLVNGLNPRDASEIANCAAGIVVGHIGTSAITIEELKNSC